MRLYQMLGRMVHTRLVGSLTRNFGVERVRDVTQDLPEEKVDRAELVQKLEKVRSRGEP